LYADVLIKLGTTCVIKFVIDLRQLVGFSVSAGTLNFSTIKTEPHDIIEMLMKKALGIQKPQSIQ
jgi:hypothetical protein